MTRFAVFDIDGTLIRWQLFHAIVHSLGKQGYIPVDAHGRINDARKVWKQRDTNEGFSAYEDILLREYLGAIKKIEPENYLSVVQEVFEEYKDQTYIYTRDLIRDLKAKGYVLIAISGSQQEVVEKLAIHQGFDYAVGSILEQVDGRFTGNTHTPIFDKSKVLKEIVKKHNLSLEGSFAVGDSSSDVPMLEMVENPIAFNPDKKLFNIASKKDWKIVVERKNMFYELESHNGQYTLNTD